MLLLKQEHQCQIDDDEMPNEEEDSSETEVMLNEATLEVLINLSLCFAIRFRSNLWFFQRYHIS